MSDMYVLDGHTPVKCEDTIEWGKKFEIANRRVAEDQIGDVRVSTVFLGIDHSFGEGSQPILFETMVFGGVHDQDEERYCTWEEAEAGHKRIVEKVKSQAV